MATKQQQRLENILRRAMAEAAKTADLPEIKRLLPVFTMYLDKIIDQPSHSKWYLDDLEAQIKKEFKGK